MYVCQVEILGSYTTDTILKLTYDECDGVEVCIDNGRDEQGKLLSHKLSFTASGLPLIRLPQ